MPSVVVSPNTPSTLQKLAAAYAVSLAVGEPPSAIAAADVGAGVNDGAAFGADWGWALAVATLAIAALYVWRRCSSLRQENEELTASSTSLLLESAKLMQTWVDALSDYFATAMEVDVCWLEDDPIVRRRHYDLTPLWNDFVLTRLTEAYNWLDSSDEPRISVWVARYPAQSLSFAGCTHQVSESLRAATFGAHEGIAGAAFSERTIYNVVDPTRHPRFKPLNGVPYPYRSMLVVPVCYGSRTLGALCIDRMREETFASSDVMILRSLAGVLSMALALAEENRLKRNWEDGGGR